MLWRFFLLLLLVLFISRNRAAEDLYEENEVDDSDDLDFLDDDLDLDLSPEDLEYLENWADNFED
uniref:Anionic-Lyc-2 n=1 Tax=Lychas buchari TaxID=1330406 RepID=T1DEN3_9SCOR